MVGFYWDDVPIFVSEARKKYWPSGTPLPDHLRLRDKRSLLQHGGP